MTRPRAYKKEAQEIGKREGMDVVAIRAGNIFQAGFAPKGQGAAKGMYSLAAALSAKLGPSWIGAFALKDGRYAFAAVNEGTIVPGCDMIGTRDEVEHRLRTFFSAVSNWRLVYAPAGFDFGGEEADIETLLAPGVFTRRQWAQHQLYALTFGLDRQDWIRIGAGAALLIAAVVGLNQYQSYQARVAREKAIRAEIARKAEEERLKALAKAGAQIDLDRPWGKEPSAPAFVAGCVTQLNATPLSIGGWIFGEAECSSSTVHLKYLRRDGATSAGFLRELATGVFAEVAPTFTKDQKEVTFVASIMMDLKGSEDIVEAARVLPAYGSRFQQHGLQVSFDEQKVEKPVVLPGVDPAAAAAAAESLPKWHLFDFRFDTPESPADIFSGSDWAGVRLSKVGVKLEEQKAELKWNVTGKLYAK